MALLFRRGKRPTAAAVKALAGSSGAFAVVHEPGEGENWLELLANGLSFDLRGLAGGPAAESPAERHRFELEASTSTLEAVLLAAGPHLAAGAAMPPIVRSQLALALRLAELPGLAAIAWTPARSWMGPDYFARLVAAWLAGGPFPALGLTALLAEPDGGLLSEGLAFFTGQELRLEPELAGDPVAGAKLAVRLIDALVELGPVTGATQLDGPAGEALALEPSANRRFVRVRPVA